MKKMFSLQNLAGGSKYWGKKYSGVTKKVIYIRILTIEIYEF
jgi:hypothetical protein